MVAGSPMLPPFLRRIDPAVEDNGTYAEAIFTHSEGLGSAHSIWWHPAVPLAESTVILFVPGNPGLAAFYTGYLSELHSRSPNLAILAHSHLAHTPKVLDQSVFTEPGSVGLPAQLRSAIEALDAVKQTLQPKNIVLIGHSLGGWLCLQVRLPRIIFCRVVFRFHRYLRPAPRRFLAFFYSSLRYATWQRHQMAGSYP
jgi:pimeloyl-ACP methyl ester carboxylesterase